MLLALLSITQSSHKKMYHQKRARSEHAAFIKCINDIYSTLIELRFFHHSEVVFPPYNVPGKPYLATSALRRLGFTDEVLDLLQEIPYPSNELMNRFSHADEGVPIAPDSFVVSYLAGSRPDIINSSRQPFLDGEVGIPAWAFKITFCRPECGTTYLYDTRLSQYLRSSIIKCQTQRSDNRFTDSPHRSNGPLGLTKSLRLL